ncbi:MAG: CD1871A family CXXC motif-containing protein [Anaerovoracaceae bacterium]
MDNGALKIKYLTKYILLCVAILFIAMGMLRSEHLVVLKKAVNICLECIGVG